MQADFIFASKNTRTSAQAAASLETIYVLTLLSQRYITHAHCARYSLQIFNNYSMSARWIWDGK